MARKLVNLAHQAVKTPEMDGEAQSNFNDDILKFSQVI